MGPFAKNKFWSREWILVPTIFPCECSPRVRKKKKKTVPDVTYLLCESKYLQTSLTVRLIWLPPCTSQFNCLFFLFFFLICLSLILRQKLDRISGEFRITECELCEVKRVKKKEKNQVKWILVRNSGEWIITKVKITGFNYINILVLMGKNRFGANANTSEKKYKITTWMWFQCWRIEWWAPRLELTQFTRDLRYIQRAFLAGVLLLTPLLERDLYRNV